MTAFRVYAPDELGPDGYPPVFHRLLKHVVRAEAGHRCIRCLHPYRVGVDGIMEPAPAEGEKLADTLGVSQRALDLGLELVADDAGLLNSEAASNSQRRHWSACDVRCCHGGPVRIGADPHWVEFDDGSIDALTAWAELGLQAQALWRILTVHHLDGDKANNRWWNLAALCQRCHLVVQGKVQMARAFIFEHSDWMKPYAAGFYADKYLGEDLTRSEVESRQDELLGMERLA